MNDDAARQFAVDFERARDVMDRKSGTHPDLHP